MALFQHLAWLRKMLCKCSLDYCYYPPFSSWRTRRRWWKTRPPACSCWRFRLQIQTWAQMARSPTPSTVPTQTSSISTTGRVGRRLFGVKAECFRLESQYHQRRSCSQRLPAYISSVITHPSHFVCHSTSHLFSSPVRVIWFMCFRCKSWPLLVV